MGPPRAHGGGKVTSSPNGNRRLTLSIRRSHLEATASRAYVVIMTKRLSGRVRNLTKRSWAWGRGSQWVLNAASRSAHRRGEAANGS